jgi:DNA-binding LytR/AlgR family response regulator
MGFQVAVCDDEEIVGEGIKARLLKWSSDYQVDIYCTGDALLNSEKVYDYIFMDVEMPGIGGLETAEELRKRGREDYIIFLTSHVEIMPEAFKVKAFRFLSKPVEEEKFQEAVAEVEKEILSNEKILLDLGDETRLLNIKDLVCFEAYGDGTYIYTRSEILESKRPLKYWVRTVGKDHFYQVSRSYVVALRYVGRIGKNEITMSFMRQPISVSRRRMSDFKEIFFDYVRKHARIV